MPDWLDNLSGLAGEVTREAARRLDLLRQAGLTWQARAEKAADRKEN
jgi:hypothetical protein